MKPYEGLRVLDLTHVLAGPFCTYQLAVLGADVIKIESPDDVDMMRHEGAGGAFNSQGLGEHYMAQAAGKRAMTLNLKSPAGIQVLHGLARDADVLVENYRRGKLEALGAGYEAIAALNPRIVYCSLTGFGQTGPKGGDPAYDNVIQAFSGLMAATGTARTGPVRVGPPVLDYGSGAQAALAISAALYQRDRSGRGQRIDIAMLDAALMLMSTSVMDTLATEKAPTPPGNSSASNAGYACYPTSDGLLMLGAYTGRQQARLWQALGQPDIAAEVAALRAPEMGGRQARDMARLEAIFLTEAAAHWEELLNAAGVPAARVRTLDETLAHDQVRGRSVLQPCADAEALTVPVAGYAYDTHGPAALRPPPRHGADTDTVLSELGYAPDRVSELRRRGVV